MIIIKSKREIDLMREPCKVTAELFEDLAEFIRPGISRNTDTRPSVRSVLSLSL